MNDLPLEHHSPRGHYDICDSEKESPKNKLNQATSCFTLGLMGASFLTALTPHPANAQQSINPDIPKTAIIIETSRPSSSASLQSDSILKTEIDGKALLKTIISNRKDYSKSINTISNTIKNELSSPQWMELTKEVLSVEDDVAKDVGLPQAIKISPPSDVVNSIKSLLKGKVQLVVDGEIIDVDVEEVKGAQTGDDEITIHVKGRRINVGLPDVVDGSLISLPEEQLNPGSDFWKFWNDKLDLSAMGMANVEGVEVTNGQAILSGSSIVIVASYGISYQYYLSEISKVEVAAEAAKAKRAATAAAKKKASTPVAKKKRVDNQKEPSSKSSEKKKADKKKSKPVASTSASTSTKASGTKEVRVKDAKAGTEIENKEQDVSILYEKAITSTRGTSIEVSIEDSEPRADEQKGFRTRIKRLFGRNK